MHLDDLVAPELDRISHEKRTPTVALLKNQEKKLRHGKKSHRRDTRFCETVEKITVSNITSNIIRRLPLQGNTKPNTEQSTTVRNWQHTVHREQYPIMTDQEEEEVLQYVRV